jgi:hypothetical protein
MQRDKLGGKSFTMKKKECESLQELKKYSAGMIVDKNFKGF